MISSGKMGANASGPTGSLIAGFSGGTSSNGRSGTMLYQLSGTSFSLSRNFVGSMRHLRSWNYRTLAISLQALVPENRRHRTGLPLFPVGRLLCVGSKLQNAKAGTETVALSRFVKLRRLWHARIVRRCRHCKMRVGYDVVLTLW